MLQRLYVNLEENALARLSRFAGVECLPLDGAAAPGDGAAVLIVRPPGSAQAAALAGELAAAASLGVPMVVVAGAKDAEGFGLFREAALCGVPPECVLFVEGGRVVDAAGRVLGEALRGRGIGISVAVRAAREALERGLVPEPALWEGSGESSAEPALWEAGGAAEGDAAGGGYAGPGVGGAGDGVPVGVPEEKIPERHPAEGYFDAARHLVVVFGARGNVGASTVAACLAGVLEDYDSLYLEVTSSPTGYRYFAPDLAGALRTGRYAFAGTGGSPDPQPRPCGVLVADIAASEEAAADAAYRRAGCVVLVTDGSPVSFERVGSWVRGGWRLDVLVVNRVLPGAGYPPEVYAGEYGLQRVVGIPGGFEEEAAVNAALQGGALPLGRSPDFDAAVGYLARAVLEVLGLS